MSKQTRQLVILVFALVAGFALVYVLSNYVERARSAAPDKYADEDLALQGARLKGFALGTEGMLADWYWMQSLQYIGDKIQRSPAERINLDDLRELDPRLLYPLLDNATTLDPQFMAAYSYGAIVLPAYDAAQAIRLTEKGIRDNPGAWQLYHQLGYIYWRMESYDRAAEIYARGAALAGAPPFMRMMAAEMRTAGGSRELARKMYRQLFEEAQDDQTKENAARHLLRLDSLDERDAIREQLRRFQTRNGRCAADWRELHGFLRAQKVEAAARLRFDPSTFAPLDPGGAAYLLDRNGGCDVRLDPQKTKIPLR